MDVNKGAVKPRRNKTNKRIEFACTTIVNNKYYILSIAIYYLLDLDIYFLS